MEEYKSHNSNTNNHNNGSSTGALFGLQNVGSNDKYLITKLRSYNISLEKIDGYLVKLR